MEDRIEILLRENGIPCPPKTGEKFFTYYKELVDWNSHTNLTALTSSEDFILKHILDSVLPGKAINFSNGSLVDIGTGAGFPGLPLKIVHPHLSLSLVDSAAKRVEFLKHLCNKLDIHCDIYHSRAEDFGRSRARETFDFVVVRAVAAMSVIGEYCLPLVKTGGIFAALKGPGVEEELKEAGKSLEVLGGRIRDISGYTLPGGEMRNLVVVEKITETPGKYPRRAGIPTKRPLNII